MGSLLQRLWGKDCGTQMKPACKPERLLDYVMEKQCLNSSSLPCKMGLNVWEWPRATVQGEAAELNGYIAVLDGSWCNACEYICMITKKKTPKDCLMAMLHWWWCYWRPSKVADNAQHIEIEDPTYLLLYIPPCQYDLPDPLHRYLCLHTAPTSIMEKGEERTFCLLLKS